MDAELDALLLKTAVDIAIGDLFSVRSLACADLVYVHIRILIIRIQKRMIDFFTHGSASL